MKVPNPFSTNVAVGDTTEMGLVQAPDTEFGRDKLANNLVTEGKKELQIWQNRIDKTRADDNATELQRFLIDQKTNKETGWIHLQGKNALERPNGISLEEETSSAFKRRYQELYAKCGTAAQRQALDTTFRAMDVQRQQEIAGHVIKQEQVYDMDVAKNKLETAIALGEDYRNPVNLNSGLAVARDTAHYLADKAGVEYDPSVGPGLIHTNNVAALIDEGEYTYARNYFEQYQDEMGFEQRQKVEKALRVAENKQTEADIAYKILTETNSLGEALQRLGSVPVAHRSEVRTLVRQHYTDIKTMQDAYKKDVVNAGWAVVIDQGRLPASLENDIINAGGAKEVGKMKDYLEKQSGGGVTISDQKVLMELDRLFRDHPEEAKDLDLRNYASSVKSSDLKTLASRQRNLDSTEEELFIGLAKDFGKINGLKTKQMTALTMAAAREWDAWMERHPGEMPTRDQQEQMAKALFVGNDAWFSSDDKWQVIDKNPYTDIKTLGQLGYTADVEEGDLRKFVQGRLGLDSIPNDSAERKFVEDLYLGEARITRKEWDEAQRQTEKMAKERGRTADRLAVWKVLVHNRLSK